MRFIGKGKVWDKVKNKTLCEFVGGFYKTEDPEMIKTLKEMGFKYDGDIEDKLENSQKEVEELKEKIKSDEPSDAVLKRIDELKEDGDKLKLELAENGRAKILLIEKAIELKLIKPKEAARFTLIDIVEIFIQNIG